jgi:hypothetical protein
MQLRNITHKIIKILVQDRTQVHLGQRFDSISAGFLTKSIIDINPSLTWML